jgi:galactokinase
MKILICRLNNLKKSFENEFNLKPTFIVRAPGRVNLIGEHIDYCGFGVLVRIQNINVIIFLKIVWMKCLIHVQHIANGNCKRCFNCWSNQQY